MYVLAVSNRVHNYRCFSRKKPISMTERGCVMQREGEGGREEEGRKEGREEGGGKEEGREGGR